MRDFDQKIKDFKLDDNKVAELRAKRAVSRRNQTQENYDRVNYNEAAKKHNFPQMKTPLAELFPEDQYQEKLSKLIGPSLMERSEVHNPRKATIEVTLTKKAQLEN